MNGPEVYADVTFFINFIMDFVILWATARLARINPVLKRIAAAALLGGLYAVGYLLPEFSIFYSFPVKIIFSCIMVFIALPLENWDNFKKAFIIFYGINFTVAGATIAFSYMLEAEGFDMGYQYFWLICGILSALIISN